MDKDKLVAWCRQCGAAFPKGRSELGYDVCLPCGDRRAHMVSWATVPLNKSNYVVITNRAELAMLNPKRTGE